MSARQQEEASTQPLISDIVTTLELLAVKDEVVAILRNKNHHMKQAAEGVHTAVEGVMQATRRAAKAGGDGGGT